MRRVPLWRIAGLLVCLILIAGGIYIGTQPKIEPVYWTEVRLLDPDGSELRTAALEEGRWLRRLGISIAPEEFTAQSAVRYSHNKVKREIWLTSVTEGYSPKNKQVKAARPTEPNQALEPTTPAVTIPAAQEVAPAGVVAHL